jgi:hypothetical protein
MSPVVGINESSGRENLKAIPELVEVIGAPRRV